MMEPMKYELEELLYQMGIYLVQAVPVHLELRGTEPPNGHGPGLGVQWSSDFGAGHAEDHPAAYGGRFPVHPAPRPVAEKEH